MTDADYAAICPKGSCHRHGRCMYRNHPLCPKPEVDQITPRQCEACDATDEHQEFCEGCDCCPECCNCTDTDCDCAVCEIRRENNDD